ncbi:hypothetical protein BC628DRAFT_1356264 [Trametes gibbosa]|nr:hypothetical protein BC628DRAFT_1356264 [Trametes gibbosa]
MSLSLPHLSFRLPSSTFNVQHSTPTSFEVLLPWRVIRCTCYFFLHSSSSVLRALDRSGGGYTSFIGACGSFFVFRSNLLFSSIAEKARPQINVLSFEPRGSSCLYAKCNIHPPKAFSGEIRSCYKRIFCSPSSHLWFRYPRGAKMRRSRLIRLDVIIPFAPRE